jgi:hypothetical protein
MKLILKKIFKYQILLLSIFFFFTSCNKSESYFYLCKDAYAVAGYYAYKVGDTIKLKINNDTLIYLNKSIVKKEYEINENHGFIEHIQDYIVEFNEIYGNTTFKIEVKGVNNLDELNHNEYSFSFEKPYQIYTVFYDKHIKAKEYSDTIHSVFYNDLYKIIPNTNISIIISKNKGLLEYIYNDNFKVERVF